METNVGAVTVSVADPLMPPEAAEIVVTPAATAVAIPAVLTVAMLVADEVQVTLLRGAVVPLL